jgi:hypothetical protein
MAAIRGGAQLRKVTEIPAEEAPAAPEDGHSQLMAQIRGVRLIDWAVLCDADACVCVWLGVFVAKGDRSQAACEEARNGKCCVCLSILCCVLMMMVYRGP